MADERLEHWLSRFAEVADPGPHGIPWTHVHPSSRDGTHVVLGFLVHGNEYGSLPAAVRLIERLRAGSLAWTGPVTLFLGNVPAARAERRFVDFDLNRAWSFVDGAAGAEHDRARELRPLLDRADLFLDLHQTLLETEHAFWTFPWNPVFGHWARVLGAAPAGITRPADQVFASAALKCIDEYVRDRGLPGFTIELGQKGFDAAQDENALAMIVKLLETQERIDRGETTLAAESERGASIRWFQTAVQEEWGAPERRLRPGLVSWTPVHAGEDLAAAGSPPIVVPVDGVLLFPKYPAPGEPPPPHLFHLAVEMSDDPAVVFGT
ncbi:MAG: succinylglutamate desuccinylase/aspartoacylase family protein [Alphaproteobacteria bacterium]|nr:succinylglutamate desuccinylase/aspartoacylase family protein [Alphaproteobacteria bacterium]